MAIASLHARIHLAEAFLHLLSAFFFKFLYLRLQGCVLSVTCDYDVLCMCGRARMRARWNDRLQQLHEATAAAGHALVSPADSIRVMVRCKTISPAHMRSHMSKGCKK